MAVTLREATEADIAPILRIVNHYAAQDVMLPRTEDQIRRVLHGFLVTEEDGQVVGCGSLVELTPQLVEVRSLAVAPDYQGRGLGGRIVNELVRMARARDYSQVCALTLREGFFNNLGFATVDRWALAPKVWQECIFCPKFDRCDEIAVLMNLTETASESGRAPLELGTALWQRLMLARMTK